MGRSNYHGIGVLNEFGGEFALSVEPLALVAVMANERIVIYNIGTFAAESVYHPDSGGLAVIVDVLFVRYAEYQNLGPVKSLGEAAVKHVGYPLYAVLGHTVVDHHR